MVNAKITEKAASKLVGLHFCGLFVHAWDLADDGVDCVMEWMAKAGLNTMCLATTYHNGWFLHPSNRRHRAFMTEGDASYFHFDENCYRRTTLRPRVAEISRKTDWVDKAGKRLKEHGLQLVSWTIGTHNTRIGLARPELTQQNVYGDRLPHALCPANGDVSEYLKALCRDLATHYPLWGIQLESFGWLGFVHGHHHERDLVGLTPLEQELMGLCFCPECKKTAATSGVDVAEAAQVVKVVLDAAFRDAPQRPNKHPRSLAELESQSDAVRAFIAWRKSFSGELIRQIKSDALRGTNCRLLLQTPFDAELADVVDGFACVAYGQSAAKTRKICGAFSKAISPQWNGLAQCLVQLGMGVPSSEAQLRQIIVAIRDGGCNGINFYNRSESPPRMLRWLANVLPNYAE